MMARLFIGGTFREADKVEPVIKAATGDPLCDGSADVERATEIARSVRTGTIGVNDYQMDIAAPFGGVKASGIGREVGPEGLAAYQTLKSIYRVGPSN
jgi:acyl-CoA reductase-like NAD-dependent aldehyde dehydrogenase